MTAEEWDWELDPRASDELAALDRESQQRIVSKLEEVVSDEWRTPEDYLDSLSGADHWKLRVGQFRLGCDLFHDEKRLLVLRIENRSSAYEPGDD